MICPESWLLIRNLSFTYESEIYHSLIQYVDRQSPQQPIHQTHNAQLSPPVRNQQCPPTRGGHSETVTVGKLQDHLTEPLFPCILTAASFSIPHPPPSSKPGNKEYLPVVWRQVAWQSQLQGGRGRLAVCIHVCASALCMGLQPADSRPWRSEGTTRFILPFCHFLLSFCLFSLQTINSSAKTELQTPLWWSMDAG